MIWVLLQVPLVSSVNRYGGCWEGRGPGQESSGPEGKGTRKVPGRRASVSDQAWEGRPRLRNRDRGAVHEGLDLGAASQSSGWQGLGGDKWVTDASERDSASLGTRLWSFPVPEAAQPQALNARVSDMGKDRAPVSSPTMPVASLLMACPAGVQQIIRASDSLPATARTARKAVSESIRRERPSRAIRSVL
jgi:hypothetical protein